MKGNPRQWKFRLIITCASLRKENRGLHYNLDYPQRDDKHWARDTVIWI